MTDIWYDHFIETISKRFSKKTQLTQALMELLNIEREAVYRRLRKDVAFPFDEIVKIATAWHLSLDTVIGVNSGQIPFQMRQVNYLNPSEEDANFLHYVIQAVMRLKNSPDTEFLDVCNKLSRQFLAGYESLNQFYLFKWLYEYNSNEKEVIPFSKVTISEEKSQITKEYYHAIKQVPSSSFIWDRRIFDYLISDIRYFHSIYLITDEEKETLKKELRALLDYLLEVANRGCYPETQNKVSLYLSQLNINTNYSYTFTPEARVCYIHVFEKYSIYTFNPEMVAKFKTWMQLKKRTSIQISEVDEKSRIEFFMQQQQLVDSL